MPPRVGVIPFEEQDRTIGGERENTGEVDINSDGEETMITLGYDKPKRDSTLAVVGR